MLTGTGAQESAVGLGVWREEDLRMGHTGNGGRLCDMDRRADLHSSSGSSPQQAEARALFHIPLLTGAPSLCECL